MTKNQDNQTDQDISEIKARFKKAVDRRQWSMINEKLVPMITLPVVTAGAAFSTLLGIWNYLPPEGQKIGVIAAGGLCAAITAFSLVGAFIREGKSPITNRQDAIKAMDKDINVRISPASKMNDKSADKSENSQKLFGLNQKKIWKTWSSQLENQPFKTGFGSYYKDQKLKAGLQASILFATALTGAIHGGDAFTKFNDALHWQPPPQPLIYEAWIAPPENITQAQGYLPEMIESAIKQNRPITAHEGSTLLITTHDRRGNIRVNGEPIEPSEQVNNTRKASTSPGKEIYQYTISFDGSNETIDIEIEDYRLSILINIDTPPSIHIDNVIINDENPSSIKLEYRMQDDYGIHKADLETGIKAENGKIRSSRLPSAQLPTIQAPYKDTPQGPELD